MARKRREAKGDGGSAEVQATFDEAEEQGYFGTGTPGKDRDKFTVASAAGGTDTNDDSRAAANAPTINPNAGAPGEPTLLNPEDNS